ncbi:MAG: DNA polymerase, partial [Spirosomaceae bacterium]|nr:DNA polymerase [Spirosomataceae bacterium]
MENATELLAHKTLLLVDGSSYLYRAYHAMPDLRADPSDPSSPATGAVRGMHNMLTSLHKDYPTDYAVCIFDAPGKTFRDELYPEYKAQRSPMPDDLRAQIAPIHEMVALMGWKVLAISGVEADDVIGTLARLAVEQGMQVLISSGDKDLSQLVNEHVTMIDTMNGKRRDVAGVTAEFGVPPSLMLDYQTLVGDQVDNVPGVAKVGPKTAVKWLTTYGNLEGVVANAHQITGAVGENLRQALDWLPKGRELLKIKVDCETLPEVQAALPALPSLEDVRKQEAQNEALLAFYQRMGFKSLAKSAGAGSGAGKPKFTPNPDLFTDLPAAQSAVTASGGTVAYETILTWEQFDKWLALIDAAALTALDTETTSLDEMRAEIVGISFSVQAGQAAYIPLAHDYPGAPEQLQRDTVLAKLKPWLEDTTKPKLGQNAKYDQHVFANHGIRVGGYAHDTMLQSYVLEVHRPHGLASLAERHVGRSGISYESLCGKGAAQISFSQVDVERAAFYACEDADQTLDVHWVLYPRIAADEKLKCIYELEMASSQTLFAIERNGVLIDAAQLQTQSHELGQRLVQLEAEAHSIAGQSFNLASPKQIGEIFFTKLGLPVVKKTPKGEPSTDEEVLE